MFTLHNSLVHVTKSEGVNADIALAVKMYQAADHGFSWAQWALGGCYYDGDGTHTPTGCGACCAEQGQRHWRGIGNGATRETSQVLKPE